MNTHNYHDFFRANGFQKAKTPPPSYGPAPQGRPSVAYVGFNKRVNLIRGGSITNGATTFSIVVLQQLYYYTSAVVESIGYGAQIKHSAVVTVF